MFRKTRITTRIRAWWCLGAWLCLAFLAAPLEAQRDPAGHEWWHHAVFYEIYPRSFADSNSDGVGDLKGIISRLDYLRRLGIDAIWLTPCFPSPQVDFGYDVSDYRAIDPQYGTLADFDVLVREARKRGIRVILDLVLNHSSDGHAWFLDSRSSRTSRYRDWYIWRDGRGPKQPPNNWQSLFGGSAWHWDEKTQQYYYHFFYPEQPDLNWRNPAVQEAIFDVVRFWFQRGVAGFRLDAVTTLFEDPALRDNPVKPGLNSVGDPNQEFKYSDRLPEVYDALRELRAVVDGHAARVLVGETWPEDPAGLVRFYESIHLPMNFFFAQTNKTSATEFRKQIALANSVPGWPVYVFSNHDLVRHYDRYADGKNNDAIAKITATLLLTLRGTPILYYGEEIGMENNDPKTREEVKDPIGRRFWPQNKGRDGERTPMQWNARPHAGFSSVAPWLPVASNYRTKNVAWQAKERDSILNFYRKLISLRRQNRALLDGEYIPLNESDARVLSYVRKHGQKAVLVVLNMSADGQTVHLNLGPLGFPAPSVATLLTTAGRHSKRARLAELALEPFEVYIGRISK